MLDTNIKYRIINLKESFLLENVQSVVKEGDIVSIISRSDGGEYYYCSNGFHIEAKCLEPIVSTIWLKAEKLWQSLAYVNTMLDNGQEIDKKAIESALAENRPLLQERCEIVFTKLI